MYNTVLLILYLVVLIPTAVCLIKYREVPSARRLSAGAGVAGALLAPSAATFLCELLIYVFSIGLFFVILFGGFRLLFKSISR